ncbi:MAG: DUF2674 domain-containing protein [Rickettsia sp.]|nr:DUF2674 domain-containing protein [Rickettsia sp.]
MSYKKPTQKLVLFTENDTDIARISSDIKDGWSIVNLIKQDNHYVGIMEQIEHKKTDTGEHVIFIPPRKKLRIERS